MKQFTSQLGGKLGVGLCAAGFLAIFLGWNGAASVDRIPSQFPYLISGGLLGLCLVVCGIGLLLIQNQRADRAELQNSLRELRQAMADAGLATQHPDVENREAFQLPVKRPTPPQYSLDATTRATAAVPGPAAVEEAWDRALDEPPVRTPVTEPPAVTAEPDDGLLDDAPDVEAEFDAVEPSAPPLRRRRSPLKAKG